MASDPPPKPQSSSDPEPTPKASDPGPIRTEHEMKGLQDPGSIRTERIDMGESKTKVIRVDTEVPKK
jgi:hypothetical protein